jgi:hypothetical protein
MDERTLEQMEAEVASLERDEADEKAWREARANYGEGRVARVRAVAATVVLRACTQAEWDAAEANVGRAAREVERLAAVDVFVRKLVLYGTTGRLTNPEWDQCAAAVAEMAGSKATSQATLAMQMTASVAAAVKLVTAAGYLFSPPEEVGQPGGADAVRVLDVDASLHRIAVAVCDEMERRGLARGGGDHRKQSSWLPTVSSPQDWDDV